MSIRGRWLLEDDRGETLLELVIAIMIAGVCVIAIGSGIAISIKVSDIHRHQSIAGQYLHDYAEMLQASTYRDCSTDPNYASGLPAPTNGGTWTVSQSDIKFWDRGAFTSICPSPDQGLEQVTLQMKSADGFVDESLVVVLRAPL